MGTKRRNWSREVETTVLVSSKRRCALCFGLEGDTSEKEGQIAHVDRDSSNAAASNAAWLCTRHHSRYDSTSRQAKGHTPDELRAYRNLLYEHLASHMGWPDGTAKRVKAPGVSLALFDRRVPVFRATIAFIREAVKGGRMDLKPLWAFAGATDEAVFLFDDEIAEYLRQLYRQGVRLHTVSVMLEPPEKRTPELVREDADLLLWFTEQFDVARGTFVPYLRLANSAG